MQGNNTNSVDIRGVRISALWKINDRWDALVQQNYQQMHSDGYFYAYPRGSDERELLHYQITAFEPAYNKDRYQSTSLAINGRIGSGLEFVYRGSYMTRHVETQQDYSNYMRNPIAAYYYACIGPGSGFFNDYYFKKALTGKPLQCSKPVGTWHDQASNQHQSHEVRLSTDTDIRLRGLVGLYWEKFVIDDNMNFKLGIPHCSQANLDIARAGGPDCIAAVGPLPGSFASVPGLRTGENTAFGQDVQRGYKQTALYTSLDSDLLPKVLTLTGGLRWYKYDEFQYGSEYLSEDATDGLQVDHLNGSCTAVGACGFPFI